MLPTICLNMIVKNESSIITRLLDSVLPLIDSYCICDTGSTDNTVELIESYFKEKNMTGKIVYEPFKNFCHNRNFALQACVGMSDYVLLMDADMVLKINQFQKSALCKANQFHILQGSNSFHYPNVRIIQNNGNYSYCGATHEYLNTPEHSITDLFKKDELFIEDIGDGGSKSNKFERDVKLLTDEINLGINVVRDTFYLANSYADLKRYQEAIDTYLKRIELGGWNQEVWYCYYKIGKCYQELNRFSDALYYWLEGYNYFPARLEGIYEIIKHYRIQSKHKLALQFYKIAKDILDKCKNENRDGYLFLHNHVYTHSIYYEYLVIAYYNGIKNVDNELVLFLNHCEHVSNIMSNIKFYKQLLQPTKVIKLSNTHIQQIQDDLVSFTSSSSCLMINPLYNANIKNANTSLDIPSKYMVNIRYVNYVIDNHGKYHNCEKHIITLNKTVELDHELQIIPNTEVWKPVIHDGRLYIGVEDIKIYYDRVRKNTLFIGTGYNKNNKLGIVAGNYDTWDTYELTQSFYPSSCEKNWVFVDYRQDVHVIYDWCPMRICEWNRDDSTISIVETKQMPKLFSNVRGSTCGFVYHASCEKYKNTNEKNTNEENNNNDKIILNMYEKEIWFIVHLVSYETPRHYYHMICVFDANMNLLRYSAPFKFEGEPIEYCLSIVVENEQVLINYSTWDRTTKIGVYDKEYIEKLLVYGI